MKIVIVTFGIASWALAIPYSTAQKYSLGFEVAADTVQKDSEKDQVYRFEIAGSSSNMADVKDYKISITVDEQNSTLPPTDYSWDFHQESLDKFENQGSYPLFLTLKKDGLPDRDRKLIFKISVKDGEGNAVDSENEAQIKELTLIIKGASISADYNYLAYLGTNFDLVDGIRTSNLFFATNIYIPNHNTRGIRSGFYLSLYGNRTFTSTDSIGPTTRTVRIVPETDSTAWYFSERADLVRTRVSDNIGAYCSPLINLRKASSQNNSLQLYLAPSLEFVWRRHTIEHQYSNGITSDSILLPAMLVRPVDLDDKFETNYNEYTFNYGLGVFLVHETKRISMRVHASVGGSQIYKPSGSSNDFVDASFIDLSEGFFTGRAWITEPTSGITLQAEVTNSLKDSRPYYGVTLSKALDFKQIGSFFSPITSRN